MAEAADRSRSRDKKQIGLTAEGSIALASLMERGLFAEEMDAYRVGIAYALAKGLDLESAPSGGYQTKFNAAGGLDTYGAIKDVIQLLRPNDADRPYTVAERLAEIGIRAINSRLEAQESLAEILSDVTLAGGS